MESKWLELSKHMAQPSSMLTDDDIRMACEAGFLITENYQPYQINQNFYDLRVGMNAFSYMRDPADIEITSMQPLIMRPREVVVVIVHEKVRFPEDVCGHIFTNVGVMAAGVSYATTTVDPGYEGTLRLALINHNSRPVKLRYKQTLAKLEFERLGEPVTSRYRDEHPRLGPVVPRKATVEEARSLSEEDLADFDKLRKEAYAFGEPLDLLYEHLADTKERLGELARQLEDVRQLLAKKESGQ